ncbi:hypothetical protein BAR1_06200 [Profundibacter amoris]|uniref:Uncharacterized protein n=1 Tax=Profundibacter amoris TaxID=2171755 RepID=A0A347UFD3_9RHOB|nr:hypothetical protein BAR1_06200 [Profundibacter amoris]
MAAPFFVIGDTLRAKMAAPDLEGAYRFGLCWLNGCGKPLTYQSGALLQSALRGEVGRCHFGKMTGGKWRCIRRQV